MAELWVIQLQFACYRLSSLNEHTWLLVPYYRVAQEICLIDTNKRNDRTDMIRLSTQAYGYNGNYNQMIWIVALMPDDSPRLIVRREKTIGFFNLSYER